MTDDELIATQFIGKNKLMDSARLADIARQVSGGKILLLVSGKDSLALWLWLRELGGFDITPISFYVVPGLSWYDEILNYYEGFFGAKIVRLPAANFFLHFSAGQYQPPERAKYWRTCKPAKFLYSDGDYERFIASRLGLPVNYIAALGYRATDGIGRRSLIMRNGALSVKGRRHWFGIHDWPSRRVFDILKKYDIALSREYDLLGSTSDIHGPLSLRFMYHYAREDYERVKDFYPLIGADLVRWYYVK